jgi:uncharacterized protein
MTAQLTHESTTSTAATSPSTTSSPRRRVDRPLIAFFVAAFLFPWIIWGSLVAHEHGLLGWHLPQGLALWTLLPVTFVAVVATGGRPGLVDHARRLVRWHVPARWWAVAIGLPLAFAGLATVLGAAVGGRFHLGETMTLSASLVYLVYGTGLFLLTEESAWRGFALPRLMRNRSPLAAALVLGVIWSCWHLPIFATSSESDSVIPWPGFAVMVVATSVITAWMYVATRSVLLAAVFHAVADAAYSWTGVVGTHHEAFWAAVALEVLAACAIAWRYGRQLHSSGPLSRRDAPAML